MIKGHRYLPAVNILVCFCWFRNAFQWPTKPLNFHRHMSHEKYSIHEIVNNSKHENLNKEYCFRVNNTSTILKYRNIFKNAQLYFIDSLLKGTLLDTKKQELTTIYEVIHPSQYHSKNTRQSPITDPIIIVSRRFLIFIFCTRLFISGNRFDISLSFV